MAFTTQERSLNAAVSELVGPIAPFPHFTEGALDSIRYVYDALTPNRHTLGILFALDAAQTDPTDRWVRFFIETATSQLIWGERPTGTITDETAAWVLGQFDEAPSLAILAILVRIMEEAHQFPASFAGEVHLRAALFGSLADKHGIKPKPKGAPHLRLVA